MDKLDPTKPVLKPAEQLTHHDLLEVIASERGWPAGSASLRSFKSHVKAWCVFSGTVPDTPAVTTLGAGVTARLATCTEQLQPGKAANVRWAVTELLRVYESLRKTQSLPSGFNEALRLCLKTAGWGATDLIKAINAQFFPDKQWRGCSIYEYLADRASPSYRAPKGKVVVAHIEAVLKLPEGTLASRAFKGPKLIQLGNPTSIPYRDHQSRRTKSPYALPEMPAHLSPVWREIVHWRSQQALRVRGELHVLKSGHFWARENSAKKYSANLLRFMGWMTLPEPAKPLFELTEEERWKVGKGMKVEDITLAHWLDTDLQWDYFEFLRARQHNNVFTKDASHFTVFLNSLVNHPYSFVKAHEKLAPVFSQKLKGDAWVGFVEEAYHQPILKLARQLNKATSKEWQRSPDEPLKTVFEDKDPMLLIVELVHRMEEDLAPATQRQVRAAQLRDIAMFRMGLDVPLRAQNMADLRMGEHLVRDEKTGLWSLTVPKTELKNHGSPHAQNIFRSYSAATSLAIDRYVREGRPDMAGSKDSNLLLLTTATGPKRKLNGGEDSHRMSPNSIYWAVQGRTKRYFGVGTGSNLFRHVLATSILKDNPGQVDTAAAVLNNGPNTVRESYKHLTQKDGLRIADAWKADQDLKFQQRFGRPAGGGST